MANTLPGTPYVESSDLVANYPAVSESLAERVDLVGVLPFANSTARGTALPTPTDGQYSYLQDSNTTEFWNGSAWQNVSKILQVVRATDTTNRSTTSTSYVDVTGLSVTITPQKSTSSILVMAYFSATVGTTTTLSRTGEWQLADGSNVALSGAQRIDFGFINATSGIAYTMYGALSLGAYVSPATTSPVTYKVRFRAPASNTTVYTNNDNATGQIYAIEVSA